MASHTHNHNDNDFDPGSMYDQQWVKDLVRKIQVYLQDNKDWLGLDEATNPRVLDYACGHGTITLGLLDALPNATFQGIDLDSRQVTRYNDEATNASTTRMRAVQGDLASPSPELNGTDWFGFDVVIMSMALHHVPDPISMLVQLRKRLRSGGVLIIVEWLNATHHAHGHGHGYGHGNHHDHHEHQHGHSHNHGLDGNQMVDAPGGQQVWPGFTVKGIREGFIAAGFDGEQVDIRTPGVTFHVPKEISNTGLAGENELVFARAVASAEKSSL